MLFNTVREVPEKLFYRIPDIPGYKISPDYGLFRITGKFHVSDSDSYRIMG